MMELRRQGHRVAIHSQVKAFQGRGQPFSSVDTKRKELVGEFKNAGKPLRYSKDRRIVYSPGKDLMDAGGNMDPDEDFNEPTCRSTF